jgi:hypothetical protein
MPSAVIEWEGKLEGIIEKYAGAEAEVQQLAVDKIAEDLGAEAAAELKRRLARLKPDPVVVEMPRIRRREKEFKAGVVQQAIVQQVVAQRFKPIELEPAPRPAPVVEFDQSSLVFQHSKSPRGIAQSLESQHGAGNAQARLPI